MKRFILGILSVACVFSFAACKNQTTSDNLDDNVIDINENNNLFASFETADTYTAYRVYLIKEDDTIDTILKKYNVTKDDLSAYNDLSDIKYGDKIIIPYKRYE